MIKFLVISTIAFIFGAIIAIGIVYYIEGKFNPFMIEAIVISYIAFLLGILISIFLAWLDDWLDDKI